MYDKMKPDHIIDETGLNNCPIKQPCNNLCDVCNHFNAGDLVRIVTSNFGGYPAIVTNKLRVMGTLGCEILDCNMETIARFNKFPSGLRKILEPNDIQYWMKLR